MWLAELLARGLIRASFVPNAQTQEMRNLLRTRKQLVRAAGAKDTRGRQHQVGLGAYRRNGQKRPGYA
jgi:transposase